LQKAGGAAVDRSLVLLSLEPSDRTELHRRIAQRFDGMLAAGLVEEVRALHARGDLHERMPSMRCVGYRQVWDHLEDRVDGTTMRERGIAATRQLAKRQITWLRAMPDRIVVDCLAADATGRAVELALRSVS
jgi:tRNA dimethylallyltransferase